MTGNAITRISTVRFRMFLLFILEFSSVARFAAWAIFSSYSLGLTPQALLCRLLRRLRAHITIALIDYLRLLLGWNQARDRPPRESHPGPFATRRIVRWHRAQSSDRRWQSCSPDK